MKVKELIEELKKYDQEKEVRVDSRAKKNDITICTAVVECTLVNNEKWSTEWEHQDIVLLHAREKNE